MTPALRAKVRRRARGRCEYCRTPFRYSATRPEVDHIIAVQHRGRSILQNLAMSCAHCNAHKGPNIAGEDPLTGSIVRLFNPRTESWDDHFKWRGASLLGKSPTGRATIHVLFINDPLEVAARRALMDEGVF